MYMFKSQRGAIICFCIHSIRRHEDVPLLSTRVQVQEENAVCVIRDLGRAGNWSRLLPAVESTGTRDIHALQALNTACKSIAFYQTLPATPGSSHKDSAFPWASANQSWVLNIVVRSSVCSLCLFPLKKKKKKAQILMKLLSRKVTHKEAKVLPHKSLI